MGFVTIKFKAEVVSVKCVFVCMPCAMVRRNDFVAWIIKPGNMHALPLLYNRRVYC